MRNKHTDILKFFVAGINYKKTNDLVRGSFAIGREQYDNLLALAPSNHLQELFVLSTCNRTEIYGFAESADQLIDLLCSQTHGSKETFTGLAYIKNGLAAIKHLFNVAAGLDSQILGDYEIVGQIKQAVRFAKEKNFIGSFLERLTNQVLQSSKLIKNQTALSDGTVSVSFAAVQYIRENISQLTDKNILVLGIGKIGRNTCKNLKDYLRTNRITLINRSIGKAAALAGELGLQYAPMDKVEEYIHKSDIILVATNASEPILLKSQVENRGEKLLIDLSIPFNVEKNASSLPGITLVTVDDLSKLKDETLQKREAEIPKATTIVRNAMKEFMEWHEMRRHVVVLKAVKIKLQEIHTCPLFVQIAPEKRTPSSDENIQRVINGMASKMRRQNQPGCNYIEAINEFMATGTN
ncbi:MAG TPA: glutamyl-tRNA reductase [Puia sp.]|nr:glutamyl-tRNA reductase [Puia sp.]